MCRYFDVAGNLFFIVEFDPKVEELNKAKGIFFHGSNFSTEGREDSQIRNFRIWPGPPQLSIRNHPLRRAS
jgi:hypothetical protein